MIKKLDYFNFNLNKALESEFQNDVNFKAFRDAQKEEDKIRTSCEKTGQARKNYLNRQCKRIYRDVNFSYNFEKLKEKYTVLKRTVFVNVDGRKCRSSAFLSQLRSQVDMAVEMGQSTTLVTSNTGERAYIRRVINY
jgi:hypothetical protein